MKSYFKFTFHAYIIFQFLFLAGVINRGFSLPSNSEALQFIICLPYFICSIFGIILAPEREIILTVIHFGLIYLNYEAIKIMMSLGIQKPRIK